MKITETLKNFKKYAKGVKRKIALLAGLSVSLTACGTEVPNENKNKNVIDNLAVVQEAEEKVDVILDSVEETTNEKGENVKVSEGTTENGEKVKITETTNEKGETVKVIETTNEKGETVKVTEKTNDNGETVKVTEKTDENGNVTEKTEEVTESRTEINIEPKTEQVTTTKVGSNIKPTTQTTAKPVTTTKVTTKPIQTTAKPVVTTTQTTAKPIVTTQAPEPVTQAPTKPIKTNFTKYDLLDQDPEVAAAAFDKLSEQLWKELYNGKGCYRDYGMSNGYGECQVALAILNYDQGINPEVFSYQETLGDYDYETILNMSHTLDFASIENYISGTRVDFKKYMLDETKAEYINNTCKAWIDNENGNEEGIIKYVGDFYQNMYGIDPLLDYYTISLGDKDESDTALEAFLEEQNNYDRNVVDPLYNSYASYIGHSYRR